MTDPKHVEQTDDIYLVIAPDGDHYCKTATEAVGKAGVPIWWAKYPIEQVSKLQPGDEMSVGRHASIYRLTGRDVTMTYNGSTDLPWES